jgi:ribosomal protein L6P/L9E
LGEIFFVVPDNIEEDFRLEAQKKFKGKKGALSKAIEEAMTIWVEKQRKRMTDSF